MSQPIKSRVFFLVLCIAYALAIIGTIDLHAAPDRQVNLEPRVTRGADAAEPAVDPAVRGLVALTGGAARVALDPATGLATFVGFGQAGFTLEAPATDRQTAEDRARAFLGSFGAAFGIVDEATELELAEVRSTGDGTQLRFIQLHRGLRVLGGELRVYFDADRNLSAVDSRFEAGLDVDPRPALTHEALEALANRYSATEVTVGALVVYRTDSNDGLAYESQIGTGSAPAERVVLDGANGHAVPAIEADPTPETRVETRTLKVDADEQTVILDQAYTSPVVVCSAAHANNTAPAVVRVNRVTANSFDIRLQSPGDVSVVYEETVHCIVAEEGQHVIDGHRFEARQYMTSITDGKGRWTGTAQSYLHEYERPAVIGQVIGMNDEQTEWSVFWNQGSSRTVAPTSSALTTGRTVLEDSNAARGAETVAFMVFESGHGIIAGVEFEASVGPRTVSGAPNGAPFAYAFETAFASAPGVILNQMAGVVGGDGGWSQTFGPQPATATTLNLFIDEDQLSDAERSHNVERVAYTVFAADFTYPGSGHVPQTAQCDGRQCADASQPKLESFVVRGVDAAFRTVAPLTHSYDSPVVVCNAQYVNNAKPVVTRIDNVTATGFDLRLQNPSGESVLAEDVHCIVVEQGVWQRDGVRFEAQKYETQVTDRHTRWLGQRQVYGQPYAAPVVIGQVMSFNDADFSVYWQKGTDRDAPPSAAALTNGMTVLQDRDTTRNREVIGFIVFESGHGPFLGSAYEAATGADSVRGVHDRTPYTYAFQQAFAKAPTVAVTSMAGANGGDGGWSQLHGANALTRGTLNLSIDEDQIQDSERSHMNEQVSYVVFESAIAFPAPAPPARRRGRTPAEPCDGLCDVR